MGNSSYKRQQYFQKNCHPKIVLPSGSLVSIKCIEVFPESIGIHFPSISRNELVVRVAEDIERKLSNRTIGVGLDDKDEFIESIIIDIEGVSFNTYAKFKLLEENYVYFLSLLYIS